MADNPNPPYRPRLDPKAARIIKSFRVRPVTAEKIEREAKRTGDSQGQVIDRLAEKL